MAVAFDRPRFLRVLLDEGLVGHTFLSFIFDNAPPLSISIETRPEVGEGFSPIVVVQAIELIYVVGETTSWACVPTTARKAHTCIASTPPPMMHALLIYLARINELADRRSFIIC